MHNTQYMRSTKQSTADMTTKSTLQKNTTQTKISLGYSMAFHRYFVREDDEEEHIENDHFRQICEVCGAAITRKGDNATHIALINAQIRSFAIFDVFKFCGVLLGNVSKMSDFFSFSLSFLYSVSCNIFRCN